jgi:hypothetical protein
MAIIMPLPRTLHEFVARNHRRKRAHETLSGPCRLFSEPFGGEHLKGRDTSGHREVVFRECGYRNHRAIHAIEYFVKDLLSHQDGAERYVAAGQRLGEEHDIRLDIPVLDGKESARTPETGLNLVGD